MSSAGVTHSAFDPRGNRRHRENIDAVCVYYKPALNITACHTYLRDNDAVESQKRSSSSSESCPLDAAFALVGSL